MVLKHPMMFLGADVVAINKVDLADAMGVSPTKLMADVTRLNPRSVAVGTSCRNGVGVEKVVEALGLKAP